jgi:hypothetical protein
MVVTGTMTVSEKNAGSAIDGLAGMGHIILIVILFFAVLKSRLLPSESRN